MTQRVVAFADIPSLVGETVVGETFSLTREDQLAFEKATWVDRAYPDPDPPEFPEDVVEGFFLLSLLDALTRMALLFDPETCWALNYGLDRVRFVSELSMGDRIVPSFEILSVREKNEGYLVLKRCTLSKEGASRPGMVADWLAYISPRKQAGGADSEIADESQ